MVARQDHDTFALSLKESIGQTDKEFLGLRILPLQLIRSVRRTWLSAIYKIAADNGHQWLRDIRRLFFELFKIILRESRSHSLLISSQVAMEIGDMEN